MSAQPTDLPEEAFAFAAGPTPLLRKDLREAAKSLGVAEIRFLVDTYYSWQKFRIASNNQVVALTKTSEPHTALAWTQGRMLELEKDVLAMLDSYTRYEPTGICTWARAICGIGPVIAAGLAAHIDITQAPTVGHIWRFAGLDPTSTWDKNTKRPWNAGLKVLCYKAGESFVKVQHNPRDVYGKVYAARKQLEQARSDAGQFSAQAVAKLERFKIGKDTEAYKWYAQGKLPPAQLHARARRYAVKLFLAMYHAEAFRRHYGKEPPLPYAIEHLGHTHTLTPEVLQRIYGRDL